MRFWLESILIHAGVGFLVLGAWAAVEHLTAEPVIQSFEVIEVPRATVLSPPHSVGSSTRPSSKPLVSGSQKKAGADSQVLPGKTSHRSPSAEANGEAPTIETPASLYATRLRNQVEVVLRDWVKTSGQKIEKSSLRFDAEIEVLADGQTGSVRILKGEMQPEVQAQLEQTISGLFPFSPIYFLNSSERIKFLIPVKLTAN